VVAALAVLVALLAPSLTPALDPPEAAGPPAIVVRQLDVAGHRRVAEAVILGRITTAVGDPFEPLRLTEDVRAVFALGFFDDVRLRIEALEGGVAVTFLVDERPFVRDIAFAGHRALSRDALHARAALGLGSVHAPAAAARAADRLREAYEEAGYLDARITPGVEPFADGDVRVVFRIEEGPRTTVGRVVIEGNHGVPDRDIKRILLTRERRYLVLRDVVERARLEADVERILALYHDRGYVQARVEGYDVAVDRARGRATVTFRVVEGAPFRLGHVRLAGVTLFPEGEVRRQLALAPGEPFSRRRLHEGLRNLSRLYATVGRGCAGVRPVTTERPDGAIDLTLEVEEGPETYIERIEIAGNTRTADRVIRRELPLAEGELLTLPRLERARQRLENLGYFERVTISTTGDCGA
jgi:outer membrane protein insertion porin family